MDGREDKARHNGTKKQIEMDKRKLVFSSFNFAPPFLGPVLHVLQTLIDQGHRPYFVTCLKSFPACGFNLNGLAYMCDICEHRWQKNQRLIEGEFDTLRLEEMVTGEDWRVAKEFMDGVTSITREVYFEGFDAGESVLSSYISKTRDRDGEFADDKVLRSLLLNTIVVYQAVKRYLAAGHIDEIFIFNGRWDYYRAVLRAAAASGIPCEVFENFRTGGFMEFYGNDFPHIIRNKQRKYDQWWDDTSVPLATKKQVAADYFGRKRKGANVFGRVYTADQKRDELPGGLDPSRKLIVLFNSSDDEFAAVAGDEYKNPFYKDQLEGILHVVSVVAAIPDLKLVIRMHPGLKGLSFGYLKPIYDLPAKYPNIIVLNPESTVDSYALIDAAWKVVVFGSSIGVEANYWRKPVVLLGRPSFFYSDVAHLPSGTAEIPALLTDDLEPKPIIGSEKIAYYHMSGGTPSKYYNNHFGKEHSFKGKRLDSMSWIRKNLYRLSKLARLRTRDKRPVAQ
jgi:hypothetical protein